MPRQAAAAPCTRCGHAEAKHVVLRSRECTVRVPKRRHGSKRRGTARLVYCDCPGYLAVADALAPIETGSNARKAVNGG